MGVLQKHHFAFAPPKSNRFPTDPPPFYVEWIVWHVVRPQSVGLKSLVNLSYPGIGIAKMSHPRLLPLGGPLRFVGILFLGAPGCSLTALPDNCSDHCHDHGTQANRDRTRPVGSIIS